MAAAVASAEEIRANAYVGFDTITQQIEHKLLKRGFQFNVIVVGALPCLLEERKGKGCCVCGRALEMTLCCCSSTGTAAQPHNALCAGASTIPRVSRGAISSFLKCPGMWIQV